MKFVTFIRAISGIMAFLTILAASERSGFAGGETAVQLNAVFESCAAVEANRNRSLPLYEEAISSAKTELDFLRRIGGASQACLRSLEQFTMSHSDAYLGRCLGEDMLQHSRRVVASSLREMYYDILKENRNISERAQKEAAEDLREAYRNCAPQEYE